MRMPRVMCASLQWVAVSCQSQNRRPSSIYADDEVAAMDDLVDHKVGVLVGIFVLLTAIFGHIDQRLWYWSAMGIRE